jgi:hypothetical protein
MDVNRLNRGEQIAGIAGVALILIMFIFDWFSVSAAGGIGPSFGGNAWEVFDFIDIVLFITALSAIALALVAASATEVNAPVALSAVTAGLGILSTILVLYRIIDPPDGGLGDLIDVSTSIGVWLGLICSAAIAYGGWAAMQEEGATYGQVGGGTPPPPPPPPAA